MLYAFGYFTNLWSPPDRIVAHYSFAYRFPTTTPGHLEISIMKLSTGPIKCCVPTFVLVTCKFRLEVFALQKNALPAGNAGKGALSRQFINRMNSLLSTTPNAMFAAIATRFAQLVPLKSLLHNSKAISGYNSIIFRAFSSRGPAGQKYPG